MIFKKTRTAVDASLFVQVLALMAGALILAQATNLLVLYFGPVPQPEAHTASEIIAAYLGKPPADPDRRLETRNVKELPKDAEAPLNTTRLIRRNLAARLEKENIAIDPGEIRVKDAWDRWYGRRSRLSFGNGNGNGGGGPNNETPGGVVGGPVAPLNPGGMTGNLSAARGPAPGANDVNGGRGPVAGVNNPGGNGAPGPNSAANFDFSREDLPALAPFVVAFHQPDGSWQIVQTPPGWRPDPWQQRSLITFAVTFLVALIAAYLFTRRLTAPFTRLAESAERLGRDPNAPPVSVDGPRESRSAARAFNVMQERLRRYVDDRTAMVGAIAHDLRTPLTRLRFRIESLPVDQKSKMSTDLDQMEAMVAATLSFVRDATQAAQRTKLELSSVLESLADEMSDMGASVTMERSDKVVVEGDPVALKRLFGNLLDNAVKYGKVARVRVFKDDGHAIVEIDDDGPGVPDAEKERVFEPFYRREPSRNRDTGGIGLGLAVVRTVARAHGGDAELINRPGGGMTARVSLPV
ncbi:MAG: HAMP domain-containing sensor histidine kinase [Alphaproteobacteria bacterium]